MKRKRKMLAIIAGAALLATAPHTYSKETLDQIVGKAEQAAKTGNWSAAYPFYKQATEQADEKKFGGKVGYLWYRRGQSAQKMAKAAIRKRDKKAAKPLFEDAINAYRKCKSIKPRDQNQYQNRAVYNAGECFLALENYKDALKCFATFVADIDRKNPAERVNPAKIRLNKSLCYLKMEPAKISKGKSDLAWVLRNKAKFKVSDAAVVKGFHTYCEAVIKKANDNDDEKEIAKLEKSILSFVQKYRGRLQLRPLQMYPFTPFFLKLVVETRAVGMDRASFALMSFLPNTTISQEDMELALSQIGERKAVQDGTEILFTDQIKKSLELLKRNSTYQPKPKQKGKTYQPHEITQNILLASALEQAGNTRAAHAVYEMIEFYHKDHPKREEYLYHLIRTANNILDIEKTTQYGQLYLDTFPRGKHVPDVEKYMLTSLYRTRRYDDCITIATKLLNGPLKNKEGNKQHDIALFTLAGSKFYTGQLAESIPLLSKHIQLYGVKGKYKRSEFAVDAQYLEASNLSYLQNYGQALKKLNQFLKDHSDPSKNKFYASAKYDRANCYTNLTEIPENYAKAIADLTPIIEKFRDSGLVDRAYTLRGANHQNIQQPAKAKKDFLAGLEIARRINNEGVEQEVLYYLVLLLTDEQAVKNKTQLKANYKEAVQYYDQFWKKYGKTSFYKSEVAVSGIPALRSFNQGKRGLANLKGVIEQLANAEGATGMAEAINSYTDFYLEEPGNTPPKLKDHYKKDFPFSSDQILAKSLVKMSLVEVYKKLAAQAKKDKEESQVEHWNAQVKAELDEIASWPLDELNNFTLVSIGNSILDNAQDDFTASQASRFYEQVFANKKANKDKSNYNNALFGQAQVLMRSADSAKITDAYTQLKDVYAQAEKGSVKQNALRYMINISLAQENHQAVITDARKFLKEHPRGQRKSEVRYSLMLALAATGDKNGARLQATSIVASPQRFKYSCDAIMLLADYANDKYEGWLALNSFIKMTQKTKKQNESKIPAPVLAKWEAVAEREQQMKQDPAVKAGIARQADIDKMKKKYNK